MLWILSVSLRHKTKAKMKNLADLKRKLSSHTGTIVVIFDDVLQYDPNHPGFKLYENGRKVTHETKNPATVSRVQAANFSLLRNEKEVWNDFGKAVDWSFPDQNTAIQTSGYNSPNDHSVKTTLTYVFKND